MDPEPSDTSKIRPPDPGVVPSVVSIVLEAGKAGVYLLACLYAVGLLIVNLDLGRYGVVMLDLARAEYVMAGTLWALTTMPVAKVFELGLRRVRNSAGVRQKLTSTFFFLFATLVAALLANNVVTSGRFADWSDRNSLLVAGIVIANAVGVWMIAHKLGESITAARQGDALAWLPGYDTIVWGSFLLVCLAVYAGTVFPEIPKRIGGGERSSVRIRLMEPLPNADLLELPLSVDRRTIGPVVLLFEGETRVTVSLRQAARAITFSPRETPGLTVTINRDRITLIEYIRPREDLTNQSHHEGTTLGVKVQHCPGHGKADEDRKRRRPTLVLASVSNGRHASETR